MGGVYLLGRDSDIWEDPVPTDLIALKNGKQNDLFYFWMNTKFIRVYHRVIGRFFRVCGCCLSKNRKFAKLHTRSRMAPSTQGTRSTTLRSAY